MKKFQSVLQYKIFIDSLLNKDQSELNEGRKIIEKNLWFLKKNGKIAGI